MTQVSGSLGQFVGVNSLNKIFYGRDKPSMPFTWTQIGSSTDSNTHVSFDYPKVAAVIGNSVGYISDVTVSTPLFTMLTPPVPFKWIDISVGSAYAIGTDNKIYYCPNITASQWSWSDVTRSMSGTPMSQVSYDTNSVVVLTTGNKLWSATNVANPTWTELKGKDVKQMSLKNKNIFAIGTDNNIWYSPSNTNATWSQLSGNMVYVDSFYPITSTIFSGRSAGNASCEAGYKLSGNKCVSECPLEYIEGETQCFKNSTSRTVNPPNAIPDLTHTCGWTYQANFKPGAKCVSIVDGTESSTAPLSEAFAVSGSFTQLEAQAKCESYGCNLASYTQVGDAQAAGGAWNGWTGPVWGWIADDGTNIGQISYAAGSATTVVPKQAGGTGKRGAICYGVKPSNAYTDIVWFGGRWNQAPQCEAGYVLKLNSTCLSICPTGTYGTSTYCNYAPTDKTSTAKVNVNFTCPTGYDAPDVTACSKVTANNTCETGTPTCYEACPAGYIRNGTTCKKLDLKPKPAGTAATATTYSCPAGYTLNSANTCDEKCPPGYTQNINVCSTGAPTISSATMQCTNPTFPKLYSDYFGAQSCRRQYGPGQVAPVSQCPQGTTPSGSGSCFTCPVISGTSATIQQPRGLPAGSRTCTDIPLRQLGIAATATTSCPDGYELDTEGKICYEKCSAGFTLSVTTLPPDPYSPVAAQPTGNMAAQATGNTAPEATCISSSTGVRTNINTVDATVQNTSVAATPSIPSPGNTYCPNGYATTPGESSICTNVPKLTAVPRTGPLSCPPPLYPKMQGGRCSDNVTIPTPSCPPNTYVFGSQCFTSQCPAGYRQLGFYCTNLPESETYGKPCPPNYTLSGTQCVPDSPCPINVIYSNGQCYSQNRTCPANYDLDGDMCYEKCPTGSTRGVGTQSSSAFAAGGVMDDMSQYGMGTAKKKFTCTPPSNVAATASTRQTVPATFIPPCPTGYKLIGTACYSNCKTGDNDLGKQCQTPAGPRTTKPSTVSTPSTTLCNANSDFINNMCVTKCPTGKISTDTSCSDSATTRTVKSVKYTSPCNRNEDLINDMCLTKCPSGVRNGSTCMPGKERVAPPSSIKCKSSDYGKYKRWLCQSRDDVDSLCEDPSSTTMYADNNDQVCSTDSPTTMMYFCQTVAEAREDAGVSDGIETVYGNTCSQLIKNYIDLNDTVSNLQLLQSGVNDGTTGLQGANMTLRKVYSNQGCTENNTTPLCKGMQKYMDAIDGNVTNITSMKSQLSSYVQQAITEKEKLLAFIRDFQCQL
jgi:hypothetical protein